MDQLIKLLKEMISTLYIEAPVTLVLLLLFLAGYYVLKVYIIKKFKIKRPAKISYIFLYLFYFVEFILMFSFLLYLMSLVGFKVPDRAF